MMHRDFSQVKVLVIGDIMLDTYLWGQVERISPEAPVPVVLARRTTHALGGAGNVAANAAAMGAAVSLVGVCGRDAGQEKVESLLLEQGIVSGITCVEYAPTITKTRVMAGKQQCLRIDEEEVGGVSPADEELILETVHRLLDERSICIVSDYGKGLVSSSLCQGVLEAARRASCPVLVDPKGKDWSRYRGADCLTPNTKELFEYSGGSSRHEDALVRTAREVRSALQVHALLVTRGEDGMLLVGDDFEPMAIGTQAREVFDVSGAGDTVIATLGLCLGAGMDWGQAARTANAAAGIVVGKVGTQPVRPEELAQVLEGDLRPKQPEPQERN